MNLNKVRTLAHGYRAARARTTRRTLEQQVDAALKRIEAEPKSMAWRLRARVGDRVKWYKDVDEVQ